jgi:nucleotide-binding universal stress UspA family protein
MPAPIIAAYDARTEDRAPVALALAAAELTGAPVVAAAVYPTWVSDGWTGRAVVDDEMRAQVDDALARLRRGLGVETQALTYPSVPNALHRLARQLDAALIVVGSTARGRVGRVLAGSTAERLLQGSPCPVALAPRGYRQAPVRTIAVGFIDTPEGRAALTAAHALAARVGARLRVIAVLHPSGGLDAVRAGGLRPPRSFALEGRHRPQVEAAVERAVAALPAGVEVETELHVDDPAEVLLRISEHVDLLVSGSRGYGPLRSVLLGGVSRRLVDEAQCPVLVLPRGVERPLGETAPQSSTAAAR